MANIVYKSAVLPAPPEQLFEMHIDSEKHQAFTGAPAEIGETDFKAFDGALTGKLLHIARPHAHLGVPDHDLNGVTAGWDSHYFASWRAYLENR